MNKFLLQSVLEICPCLVCAFDARRGQRIRDRALVRNFNYANPTYQPVHGDPDQLAVFTLRPGKQWRMKFII